MAECNHELVLWYRNVDGVFGALLIVAFTAAVAVGLLIPVGGGVGVLLAWAGVDEVRAWMNGIPEQPDVGATVLIVTALPFCALLAVMFAGAAAQFAVIAARGLRGRWWLRLSSRGLEVNDRILGPRRYAWHEIDEFLAAGVTVGMRFTAPRPRMSVSRFWPFGGPFREGDVALDATVMGYWDRGCGEAVDLLNDWLHRYRDH